MTITGSLITVLLIWLKCTGHIECTWPVTSLPLLFGAIIDLLIVGFAYWYHEVRKGDENDW